MDQPLGETSTNSSKKNTEVKVGKREESEKGRGKTEKQQNVANQKGVVKFGQDPTAAYHHDRGKEIERKRNGEDGPERNCRQFSENDCETTSCFIGITFEGGTKDEGNSEGNRHRTETMNSRQKEFFYDFCVHLVAYIVFGFIVSGTIFAGYILHAPTN
ncbi:uncharacterized protein LOC117605444 isoform X1 [Osmia lignaria lignaria]|uniref:uncharacterized protein LOC117605444 isoform X1 n=1 Tax=Osmia lignaria lignaria TaxID=1437193 RepID=UPI001478B91E|nr:uncharacterized protein LOC117605444 isoform X2 [Osmia lignaria]